MNNSCSAVNEAYPTWLLLIKKKTKTTASYLRQRLCDHVVYKQAATKLWPIENNEPDWFARRFLYADRLWSRARTALEINGILNFSLNNAQNCRFCAVVLWSLLKQLDDAPSFRRFEYSGS